MSKNIIVTGAGRGIGFELAKLLSKQGHKVVALSRNLQKLEKLRLKNLICHTFDLTKEEDYSSLSNLMKSLSSVDVLINNAGFLVNKPFPELTDSDFKQCFEVNVLGPVKLTRLLLPLMSKDSHVVNMSSMGAVQGSVKFPGLTAYSSTKAALVNITELLAEEYKENGPRFNTLAIGAVQTEMLEAAFPGYQAPLQPDEMAAYIADFALNGHKFYNGKILQVSSSTP